MITIRVRATILKSATGSEGRRTPDRSADPAGRGQLVSIESSVSNVI